MPEENTTDENKEAETAEAPAEAVAETPKTDDSAAPADDAKADDAAAEEVKEDEEATEEVAEEVTPEEAVQELVPGMVVRVHLKIKDVTPKGDERERIQVFEGMIIAKKGQDAHTATITVRKVSGGIGIERIFPINMPSIDKIEVVRRYRVKRSKLYYTRERRKKKLKEIEITSRK